MATVEMHAKMLYTSTVSRPRPRNQESLRRCFANLVLVSFFLRAQFRSVVLCDVKPAPLRVRSCPTSPVRSPISHAVRPHQGTPLSTRGLDGHLRLGAITMIIHAKPVSQVSPCPAIDNHVAILKMSKRHGRNNAIATSDVTCSYRNRRDHGCTGIASICNTDHPIQDLSLKACEMRSPR